MVARVRDQPVVRVHHVERRSAQTASPARVSAWFERHRPGQQVVGEAEQGRVLGHPDDPDPAGDLVVPDLGRARVPA